VVPRETDYAETHKAIQKLLTSGKAVVKPKKVEDSEAKAIAAAMEMFG
jgi:hypothetical protein